MIYIYRLIKANIDQFLYFLFKKNLLWLGGPLSIIARKFFLREFLPIKKTYSSLEELNKIVEKEFERRRRVEDYFGERKKSFFYLC